jgi:hypothetical protein
MLHRLYRDPNLNEIPTFKKTMMMMMMMIMWMMRMMMIMCG